MTTELIVQEDLDYICRQLQQHGTSADRLDAGCDRVCAALTRCLEDERGRWLLSTTHTQAESEFAILLVESLRSLQDHP